MAEPTVRLSTKERQGEVGVVDWFLHITYPSGMPALACHICTVDVKQQVVHYRKGDDNA